MDEQILLTFRKEEAGTLAELDLTEVSGILNMVTHMMMVVTQVVTGTLDVRDLRIHKITTTQWIISQGMELVITSPHAWQGAITIEPGMRTAQTKLPHLKQLTDVQIIIIQDVDLLLIPLT